MFSVCSVTTSNSALNLNYVTHRLESPGQMIFSLKNLFPIRKSADIHSCPLQGLLYYETVQEVGQHCIHNRWIPRTQMKQQRFPEHKSRTGTCATRRSRENLCPLQESWSGPSWLGNGAALPGCLLRSPPILRELFISPNSSFPPSLLAVPGYW